MPPVFAEKGAGVGQSERRLQGARRSLTLVFSFDGTRDPSFAPGSTLISASPASQVLVSAVTLFSQETRAPRRPRGQGVDRVNCFVPKQATRSSPSCRPQVRVLLMKMVLSRLPGR